MDNSLFKKAIFYFLFASFTITISLSWNDAFTSFIQYYFPNKQHNIIGKFIYAFILTISFIIIANIFADKSLLETFIKK